MKNLHAYKKRRIYETQLFIQNDEKEIVRNGNKNIDMFTVIVGADATKQIATVRAEHKQWRWRSAMIRNQSMH